MGWAGELQDGLKIRILYLDSLPEGVRVDCRSSRPLGRLHRLALFFSEIFRLHIVSWRVCRARSAGCIYRLHVTSPMWLYAYSNVGVTVRRQESETCCQLVCLTHVYGGWAILDETVYLILS